MVGARTTSEGVSRSFVVAVAITVTLLLGLTGFAVREILTVEDYAERLYNHPLAVSNAVRHIKEHVTAIHRAMKDVVISESDSDVDREVARVEADEAEVLAAFDLIEARFLGRPEAVEAARRTFLAWEPIRDEVIALKRSGRVDEAAAITQARGAQHVEQIHRGSDGSGGLDYLLSYAEEKAAAFRAAAAARKDESQREIVLILGCVLLLTFITVLLFRRSVRTSLALSREKEQLLVTLRSIGDGVIVTDAEGRVTLMNPTAEALTAWTLAEARARPVASIFTIINQYTRKPVASPFEEVVQTDRVVGLANHTVLVARDGVERVIADSGAPIHGPDGAVRGVVLVFRDETAKAEAEMRLRQSQKMEAIGTLAGGIAHDFNNILSAIFGYTELAQAKTPSESPAQEHLATVLASAERARSLVRQILAFSRQGQEARRCLDLAPIVKETIKLLRSTLPTSIEMQHELDDSVGQVWADPVQMHQVLMNLATNASQAMATAGGVLEITLRRVADRGGGTSDEASGAQGAMVELRVSDTGPGIAPGILPRIFDPFFTTKAPGHGTGMGLAVVDGIIRELGGEITVESEVGQGTVFTVRLPEATADESAGAEELSEPPTGDEHVLFVEDEPVLLGVGRAILESLGYSVTTAADGVEGLAAFEASLDAFDLVVTDETMPRMTGFAMSGRILALRPELPIVLCTGYSDRVDAKKAMDAGIRRLLYKPTNRLELATVLREVLD